MTTDTDGDVLMTKKQLEAEYTSAQSKLDLLDKFRDSKKHANLPVHTKGIYTQQRRYLAGYVKALALHHG